MPRSTLSENTPGMTPARPAPASPFPADLACCYVSLLTGRYKDLVFKKVRAFSRAHASLALGTGCAGIEGVVEGVANVACKLEEFVSAADAPSKVSFAVSHDFSVECDVAKQRWNTKYYEARRSNTSQYNDIAKMNGPYQQNLPNERAGALERTKRCFLWVVGISCKDLGVLLLRRQCQRAPPTSKSYRPCSRCCKANCPSPPAPARACRFRCVYTSRGGGLSNATQNLIRLLAWSAFY